MVKPVVKYVDIVLPVRIGGSAVLWPVNHPSGLVSNRKAVITSPVVAVSMTERGLQVETRNTMYVPSPETPLMTVPDDTRGLAPWNGYQARAAA